MADRDTSRSISDPDKKTGKPRPNPVGMAGERTSKVEGHGTDENEQQRSDKDGGDRPGRRKT